MQQESLRKKHKLIKRIRKLRGRIEAVSARDTEGLVLFAPLFFAQKNRSKAEPGEARPAPKKNTMKQKVTIRLGMVLVLLSACMSRKYAEPDFPDAMLPHVKVEYAKRYDKGKELYALNCARCHTTRQGFAKIVPDFKPEQLRGYALRIANAQHETQMPDSLVSEEELGIIMTFLTYKKKNKVQP